MIGNDMKLDPGVGTCGKEGQSVPVGVGQPTLRIDGLTVGGTVQAARFIFLAAPQSSSRL
jgi:TldD protein